MDLSHPYFRQFIYAISNRILLLERKVNSIVLIEAEKISMTYPKRKRCVLDEVNICFDKGELIVLNGNIII